MDDERRRTILAECRETLDRLKDFTVREPDPLAELDRKERLSSREDTWNRRKPKPIEKPRATTMDEATGAAWNEWFASSFKAHFQAAIEGQAFSDYQQDVLAAVIAGERKDVRKELEKVARELRELRAEVAKANNKSEVVDLPKIARRRDAA